MYQLFASFYDSFTGNVDYAARARYFAALLERFGCGKGILLDAACGTGSLSFEMEALGFDVIGTDISEEMLDEAVAKKTERGSAVMFLHQDITALDLFGSITAAVCHLDVINHLESIEKVERAFARVSFFMEQGGVFIFDVNTAYKHEKVLADNAFIFENEDCFLAWQNETDDDLNVTMYLDFFIPEGESYARESETIREYYYSDEALTQALEEADFELCGIFGDISFDPPGKTAQRKVFVCRKIHQTQGKVI